MASSKLKIEELSLKIKQSSSWKFIPELYGCLYIDISWLDLLYAICNTARFLDHKNVQKEIECLLGGPDRILISLSVRSSFDLFLQAMKYPQDSEIIATCINIKQMSEIAEYHGIHMKGVDLDLSSMQPDISQIESKICEKTVGIFVVQLFGMKFKTTELKKIARKHRIVLIEDCAQAFFGPDAIDSIESDIAFFSFGSIKRSTCLGGACIVSNNSVILHKMRTIQSRYTLQGRWVYFFKLVKYLVIMIAMNNPSFSWILSSLLSMIGIDYKVFFKGSLRSFKASNNSLIELIRFQPSLPLLILIKRRMQHLLQFDDNYQDGRLHAEYAICSLIEKPVYVLGCLSEIRDFWLFPVLVDEPLEVEMELEKLGVSAFSRASSLEFNHKPSEDLRSSKFVCKHVLYLPIDRRSPKWHIDNVCRSLTTVLQERRSIFDIAEKEHVLLKRDIETLLKCSSTIFESSKKVSKIFEI